MKYPAFQMFSRLRPYVKVPDILWHAADYLIDYRMEQAETEGNPRYDLQIVIDHIQEAAIASDSSKTAKIYQHLISAALDAKDENVRNDIYRLLFRLGFDCPASVHGTETFMDRTGGTHFSGGEVWDNIEDHVYCSLCGDDMLAPSVNTIIPDIEISPKLFSISPAFCESVQ
jgi:hypothetical protein